MFSVSYWLIGITVVCTSFLIIFFVLLIFLTGNPPDCLLNTATEKISLDDSWQKVHRFLANEQTEITLTDLEITTLIQSRLSDRIMNFSFCVNERFITISFTGSTNAGIKIAVSFSGTLGIKDNKLQIQNSKLYIGNSFRSLFLTNILSKVVQRKINERLNSLIVPMSFNVILSKSAVKITAQ